MDLLIEVAEVMLVRPAFDLSRVAIGPAVAIGASAVGRLQPPLILALKLLVEHHATNVGALLAEASCFSEVGAIQLGVVG